MRILLVEDEESAAQMLAKGLREHAYAVDLAATAGDALFHAETTDYDAVILDVRLGRASGFDVCRQLRSAGEHVPVLMLTACDDVPSRIAGLDAGADDYVTKPFDFGELLARLRAVLRRGRHPLLPERVTFGPLVIDRRTRIVWRDGRDLRLTAKEYALFEFLLLNADTLVDRAAIAEHVWDADYDPFSNVIDKYIQRLRNKIDRPGTVSLVQTRRGEGYLLTADADADT